MMKYAGFRTRSLRSSRSSRVFASLVLLVPLLPVLAAQPAAAATVTVQQLCGAAAPGQARCLAERQVTTGMSPLATVNPATLGGLTPGDLASAYQLDTTKGYGQTVAVVDAYDDPTAAADLAVYRSQFGLPACADGCFSKVNQTGAASPLPAANTGWAGEIALDLDMVSAVCPLCNILLVEANSSSLADLGTAVDAAVRLGAKFVSNSYGGPEFAGVGSYDAHYDHPGVAITASTGDNGYGVSFPATSPHVTAVGGTTLSRSSGGRGWTETAWSGAGSGCSGYLAQLADQAASGTGCSNRAVADVSAVANPATGVAVYGNYGVGGWSVFGGTSASSPIIAATYALAGTPGATDYPNSYPYANASSLFDVTSGSNGSCPTHQWCAAGIGWDGPTGLGSPDSAAGFSATGQVGGTPTRFGAVARVTGSVIAGLPVQLTVSPQLPDGDALGSISWKAARADCAIAIPNGLQTTVSCPAGLVGTTTVSVTVTDTLAASKTVTVPLSFAASTVKRAVSVGLAVAGQSGAGQTLCLAANTPVQAVVTDVATGQPVKGVPVGFTRQSGMTAPTAAGSASSAADGTATVKIASSAAVTLGAKSSASGPFAAGVAATLPVTVLKCSPTVTGSADRTSSYYGDPVTVTGTLTRSGPSGSVPLAGAGVQVTELVNGRSVLLGSTSTGTDGSITAVVRPTATGTLGLSLPASASWTAATAVLGPLTVQLPTSTLTATADRLDVGYADPVTVSGTLTRDAGGTVTGAARSVVSVRSTSAAGVVSALGSATVSAAGSWTVTVRPHTSGTLAAVFGGAPGLPASSAVIGALTVGTWTSGVSLTSSLSQQLAGLSVPVSGNVSRTYGGSTSGAPSVTVGIYLLNTVGGSTLLRTVTTNATGAFSTTVAPLESGTLVAGLTRVAGYTDAQSSGVAVTVTSRLTITGPSVMTGGRPVSVTLQLTVARTQIVTVQDLVSGSWLTVGTATTSATGRAVLSLALPLGNHTLRAAFTGDSRGAGTVSATLAVAVRA